MIFKLLVIVGTVIGALMVLRVLGKAADTKISRGEEEARAAVRQNLKSEDFDQCESCGAYKPRGENCACGHNT